MNAMVAQPDSIEISVVVKGEVLWDMLPESRKIGGAPANFAYHVSQIRFYEVIVSKPK